VTITFRVSRGITEKKHRDRIGPAIWIFLWLIDRQTDPQGSVLGGSLIPRKRIAAALEMPIAVVAKHIARLKEGSYIEAAGQPQGVRFRVLNQKKFRLRRGIQMDPRGVSKSIRGCIDSDTGVYQNRDRPILIDKILSTKTDMEERHDASLSRSEWLRKIAAMRTRSPKVFEKVVRDMGYRTDAQLAGLEQEIDAVAGDTKVHA
jgi:hypothetical protein